MKPRPPAVPAWSSGAGVRSSEGCGVEAGRGWPAARAFWPPAVLTAAVVLAILVLPTGAEIARQDDWAYQQVVQRWLDRGQFQYLGWSDPSLVAQAAWGALFALIFGPGMAPLRASTIVLAWLGVLALYGVARRCGASRPVALVAAGVLLFHPLYLALGWSYNTDVPYVALALMAVWSLARALGGQGVLPFVIPGLFIAAAYLVRQQGLLLAVAAAIGGPAIWSTPRGRTPRVAAAVCLLAPALLAVAFHLALIRGAEGMASLTGWTNRPVLAGLPAQTSWPGVLAGITREGVANLLTAALPLLPLAVLAGVRDPGHRVSVGSRWVVWIVTFAVSLAAAVWLMSLQPRLQVGWPFQGTTLREFGLFRLTPGTGRWTWPMAGRVALTLGAVITVAALAVTAIRLARHARHEAAARLPALVLVLALVQWLPGLTLRAVYARYALPLLPGLVVVAVAGRRAGRRATGVAVALLLLFAGLSLEWTRASFDRQQARWEVASELVKKGVPPAGISVDFAWQGAHLYLVAVDSLGARPPYDLEAGAPWSSMLFYRYAVSENRDELAPAPRRTYRSFLKRVPTEVGVRPVGGTGANGLRDLVPRSVVRPGAGEAASGRGGGGDRPAPA